LLEVKKGQGSIRHLFSIGRREGKREGMKEGGASSLLPYPGERARHFLLALLKERKGEKKKSEAKASHVKYSKNKKERKQEERKREANYFHFFGGKSS